MTERVFWEQITALKDQVKALQPAANLRPTIIGQPANSSTTAGGTAAFAVAVIGNQPLYYQWRLNGNNIPGATGPTLIISGATSGDVGQYSVVVHNQQGEAESTGASLSVTATGSDVPIGGIIMWAGLLADIPSNYGLCDGSAGTPDLRNRFVIGTPAATNPGGTGGTGSHFHAVGTLANVAVSAGTPAGTNSAPTFTGSASTASASAATPDLFAVDVTAAGESPTTTPLGTVSAPVFTGSALAGHTHTITGKTATGENGAASSTARDVYPPWYNVAFIQRIS